MSRSHAPAATPDNETNGGWKPIGQLTANIALPLELNSQGTPQPFPEDDSQRLLETQQPDIRTGGVTAPLIEYFCYGPALNFCYRPLFFEEVNLERYGYTWGVLQPAVSAARFYGNAVALPYYLLTQRPNRCSYFDHPSRPGSPAPWERRVHRSPCCP